MDGYVDLSGHTGQNSTQTPSQTPDRRAPASYNVSSNNPYPNAYSPMNSSNRFDSPNGSLYREDASEFSTPIPEAMDDPHARLVHSSSGSDDSSSGNGGGYYSNPQNPGFGMARTISNRPPPPNWHAGSPTILSDEMNPRSMGSAETLVQSGFRHRNNASKDLSKPFIVDTNPLGWDTIDNGRAEPDDYLHDPKKDGPLQNSGWSPSRGLLNLGTMVILAAGILTLFAGYPIISYFETRHTTTKGAYGLGGTNATGQVAMMPGGMRNDLIDNDTPEDARTRIGSDGKTKYNLVFSDEFNVDGRSFYPGDDPFWEAVDLHYWGTNNFEWYDPAGVTTSDGALHITLSQTPEHNLNFRGGMLSTWNKFCFTGGYVEVSVRLPGKNNVPGLWPAAWTMGNLGRAGYGASLEGTWPYSYEECDVGTLQNQTDVNGNPKASQTGGDVMFNRKHHTKALSFMSGQRLSACTCPEDYPDLHPGPKMPDGSLKGRAAPEIDIFEAQVTGGKKLSVSQSCQFAPFNYKYESANATGPAWTLFQPSSQHNTYTGEITQQSASTVTDASQIAVQHGGDNSFAAYGFEYEPGENGYVEWVSNGEPSWRMNPAFLEPDPIAQIGARVVPPEPMYVILNLGISENFATPDWEQLSSLWPFIMSVDYVRVYQPENSVNVGCDPPDFPTFDFINRHMDAYTNANLTIWGGTQEQGGYQQNWPRNRLNPNGCSAQLSNYPGSPTSPKPHAPSFAQSEIGQDSG
ncbi:hypothetical protein L7F22_052667 [Adiantum nelumboides]|nr:hypothetical protein [Adiantum nelumboides]